MQTAKIATKCSDFQDQRQVNSSDTILSRAFADKHFEFHGITEDLSKAKQDDTQIWKHKSELTASVAENPNAFEISKIIARYGVSHLTLLGLNSNNKDVNFEKPNTKTITVEGVFFNRDDGYHYAVISEYINNSFLINLTIAIEYDEAIRTRYANYLTYIATTEASKTPNELVYLPPRQITYSPKSRFGVKIPEITIRVLCDKIKASPKNTFVPCSLSGPAAPTDPFIQNPEVATVYNTPSVAGEWAAPESEEELKATLRIAFGNAVDQTVNGPWITALFNETRNNQMPMGHRGLELTLHFPVAYGHVAHIAPASLWRERHASDKPGLSLIHI